jgi:bacillithiol synthase
MTVMPGMSRLFLDFSAGDLRSFLPLDERPLERPALPAHWQHLVRLLAAQNPSSTTAPALAALAQGAGVAVTGQQVGLFGGPLYTPFKAATAVARARQATAAGHPHAAIFWLATEDHDFAEIDHVSFPAGHALEK